MVQSMMNIFSEARYYLNVTIMVIFDQHRNIIAAALGLETLWPVRTQGNNRSAYNAIIVHWNHANADMICHSLKKLLDMTEGLDVVFGEGVWCFLIIKYFDHFRLFH